MIWCNGDKQQELCVNIVSQNSKKEKKIEILVFGPCDRLQSNKKQVPSKITIIFFI